MDLINTITKLKSYKKEVDVSDWKPFKIVDLFDIQGGYAFTKNNWGEALFNYVGSSALNNGVTGKCSKWNYENIISVNYDGSVGYAFWHPYKLFLSDRCRALIPKFNYTKNICEFLSVVITKSFGPKYHYGKKLGTERLKAESLLLPEKDGEPDFEWIEEFMINLEELRSDILNKEIDFYEKN